MAKDERIPLTLAAPVAYPIIEAYNYFGGDLGATVTGAANAFIPAQTYAEQGLAAAVGRGAKTWLPIIFGGWMGNTKVVRKINRKIPDWLPFKL